MSKSKPRVCCPLCSGEKTYGNDKCPECRGKGTVVNHFALAGPGRSETPEETAAAEGVPVEEVLAFREEVRQRRAARNR